MHPPLNSVMERCHVCPTPFLQGYQETDQQIEVRAIRLGTRALYDAYCFMPSRSSKKTGCFAHFGMLVGLPQVTTGECLVQLIFTTGECLVQMISNLVN